MNKRLKFLNGFIPYQYMTSKHNDIPHRKKITLSHSFIYQYDRF